MGMAGEHFPQQSQHALVGKYRLPRRFDPAGWRLWQPCAKSVLKHPLPRIKFEGEGDRAIVEIDKAALLAPSDAFDTEQIGFKAGLPCGILKIGQRRGILRIVEQAGQMQVLGAGKLSPGVDQAFMERVELVGGGRQQAALDSLLKPRPLKYRGLENRGRRVGVVFEQFRRSAAAITEIEPAIKAAFVTVP